MIESNINKNILSTFIGGWFINHTTCDALIDSFESSKYKLETSTPYNYSVVSLNNIDENLRIDYLTKVQECLELYKKILPYSDLVYSFSIKDCNIQKYEPEKYFETSHCENNGNPSHRDRHLVFMTYLNTIYKGGGTKFFHQATTVNPQKGLTLIWPAHWTHFHAGTYTKETKYIVTGWYQFN